MSTMSSLTSLLWQNSQECQCTEDWETGMAILYGM